jgi:hypothetical protein
VDVKAVLWIAYTNQKKYCLFQKNGMIFQLMPESLTYV